MVKRFTLLLSIVLVTTVAVSACMRDYPAPVLERSIAIAKRKPLEPPEAYTIKPNDTLYSIAFRYGVDAKDLARWNGIAPPYTIQPGQRLVFSSSDAVAATPTQPAERGTGGVEIEPLPPPSEPVAEAEPEPAPPAEAEPAPPEPAPQEETTTVSTGKPEAEPVLGSAAPQWQWPTQGALLSTFEAGDSARNGIDIAGEPGQPVVAAAAGKVVYSGSGLIGYGELIIIKHNDEYLSAYGHNRKRLVSQGDTVTGGEQIAELGASGAPRPMLHFEIRVQGDPVNPLEYLPER